MEKRQLGNSDLHITRVGVGAWAMGGAGWEYSWGSQEDDESIAAIHRALDMGVNWIDTAAVYGLGHSEEIVARALKGMANKPYVFTKCSLVWDEKGNITSNLKADSVRREVEASLRRLQVDVIDLYQIHWPDPDEEIEEGWSTLVELQKEGKLRHIAVSNFSASQLQRAMNIAPITSNQPPYSAIKRGVEAEVLPFCLKNNIGVIVYSPMQAGLLTGKMTRERIENMPADDWRKRDEEYQEPRLSKNLRLAEAMADIAKRHGVPTPNVSIAWVLNNPAVTGAIVGVRHPNQVDDVIGGGSLKLTDEDIRQIENA
ncbi:MAG TPA: aldo/keto reductase [Aggregatilineales bacterium]|nr:aldo/keto reductase [Aggregatilineales bacterium]